MRTRSATASGEATGKARRIPKLEEYRHSFGGSANGGSNAIEDVVADESGVYFSEKRAGIIRLSLNTDDPTITTVTPTPTSTPTALALDTNFIYFIDGMDQLTQCTTTMTINRVSKNGGPVTRLVDPAAGCPKFISVDDTFVYWATWDASGESGSINKVPK